MAACSRIREREREKERRVARHEGARRRVEDKIEEGKNEREKKKGKGRRKVPLLGPIKKPVSASVSESLLRHSRQLRKHLKAPEKPDNTSLLECRVPPGGHCDFAPCHRDTDLLGASMCRNIATILCIKHRPPSYPREEGSCEPTSHHLPTCNPPFFDRVIYICRCHIAKVKKRLIIWIIKYFVG